MMSLSKCVSFSYEPQPAKLNPELGWRKPLCRKTIGGDWECSIVAYLHHGDAVVVKGRHRELKWAWMMMADHLVRHELLPTFEATKGPLYVSS